MALRSLDNTLPTSTPERPKKLPKTPAIHPQLNDENRAPQPPNADPSVDYIPSEDLHPIPDPESKLQIVMEGLESRDWIKVCESLNDVRRFALHHSDLLLPNLEKVVVVLVKAMKNPRSALCKTAIMAASDIFNGFGRGLVQSDGSDAFDQLLLQLLLKASQDKRFVCDEADKALHVMVGTTHVLHLLRKLRAYVSHANMRVRAKAAVCISDCVSRMGLQEMREFGLDSLLQVAASLMNDRLPEAREAARSTVGSIYGAFSSAATRSWRRVKYQLVRCGRTCAPQAYLQFKPSA
ncbi:hypothetical protein Syun_007899 [Stephania yunnanensis]|uniref:TOG domain-containing protein n=1 Tax=Stephania yunnanensis TaxID=152371 RepID=A0AAP0PZ74_9MAGN